MAGALPRGQVTQGGCELARDCVLHHRKLDRELNRQLAKLDERKKSEESEESQELI